MGGRWSREVRRVSHNRRNPRDESSVPRANERKESRLELRRSSRLVPRSDYALTERWSYGADVTYETRYDTTHSKSGDANKPTAAYKKRARFSSYEQKQRHTTSTSNTSVTEECVAFCTRSRTARKGSESASEPLRGTRAQTELNHTNTTSNSNTQAEGGLLPLDDRDFSYSPFSTSTVTDLIDSDYSVYSPTTHRRKGKKRKRSAHRASLINLDDCRKRLKVDSLREVAYSGHESLESKSKAERDRVETEQNPLGQASCSYPLRNRHHRDLPATVTSDSSGKYNIYVIRGSF